jgi:hypothetical protein
LNHAKSEIGRLIGQVRKLANGPQLAGQFVAQLNRATSAGELELLREKIFAAMQNEAA